MSDHVFFDPVSQYELYLILCLRNLFL